jgi:hypothetical protein
MTTALDSGDITKIGVGATIAIVVIGLILGMIITALVARVIILVIVVALGVFIWQQRAVIQDHVEHCDKYKSLSFFGFHIDTPESVLKVCQERGK